MNERVSIVPPPLSGRRGKIARDAARLREYARFVIVLGADGIEIIDNQWRAQEGLPYARIIAVLGPTEYGEGILLEVGYRRTRPYAQLEERTRGDASGKRWFLKPRPRARFISDEEMEVVYPHLVSCMTIIVTHRRDTWNGGVQSQGSSREPWFVPGAGYVNRGVHFTISHEDVRLYEQCMRENIRYRKEKYMSRHLSWVRVRLKRFSRSWYSLRQIQHFRRAREIAEMFGQEHYAPFYRAVFLEELSATSHVQSLARCIMEVSGLAVASRSEVAGLYGQETSFPELVDLRCYRPPDQPTTHARNATVFEFIPTEEGRNKMDIPF